MENAGASLTPEVVENSREEQTAFQMELETPRPHEPDGSHNIDEPGAASPNDRKKSQGGVHDDGTLVIKSDESAEIVAISTNKKENILSEPKALEIKTSGDTETNETAKPDIDTEKPGCCRCEKCSAYWETCWMNHGWKVLLIFSVFMHYIDIGSDVWVMFSYFKRGHTSWGVISVVFVMFAHVMSLTYAYINKFEGMHQETCASFSIFTCHLYPLYSAVESLRHNDARTDVTLTYFRGVEVCFESLPQQLLQLYVLMQILPNEFVPEFVSIPISAISLPITLANVTISTFTDYSIPVKVRIVWCISMFINVVPRIGALAILGFVYRGYAFLAILPLYILGIICHGLVWGFGQIKMYFTKIRTGGIFAGFCLLLVFADSSFIPYSRRNIEKVRRSETLLNWRHWQSLLQDILTSGVNLAMILIATSMGDLIAPVQLFAWIMAAITCVHPFSKRYAWWFWINTMDRENYQDQHRTKSITKIDIAGACFC